MIAANCRTIGDLKEFIKDIPNDYIIKAGGFIKTNRIEDIEDDDYIGIYWDTIYDADIYENIVELHFECDNN